MVMLGPKFLCKCLPWFFGLKIEDFLSLASKKWKEMQSGRLTAPRTTKMTLVRPIIADQSHMNVREDWAVSACNPLSLSIKALVHWLSGVGDSLWKVSALPTRGRHPKESRLSIPPTWILLAFERRAARPHFRLHIHCANIRGHHDLARLSQAPSHFYLTLEAYRFTQPGVRLH